MADGSHEQSDTLEGQASGDGRALRTGCPSWVGRAIPGQSHQATSVDRAERGNGPESTLAGLGLSSGLEDSLEDGLPSWLIGRTYFRQTRTGSVKTTGISRACPRTCAVETRAEGER